MGLQVGSINCQAAIFIYKDDGSEVNAIKGANAIFNTQGDLRIEHHRTKDVFLRSLGEWNQRITPSNAFLCIYSHAGEPGINPKREVENDLILWDELIRTLENGVHTLWLIGCTTESILKKINSSNSKFCKRLLLTKTGMPWQPFIKSFAEEISIDPINFFDEMVSVLAKSSPELASMTSIYTRKNSTFELDPPSAV